MSRPRSEKNRPTSERVRAFSSPPADPHQGAEQKDQQQGRCYSYSLRSGGWRGPAKRQRSVLRLGNIPIGTSFFRPTEHNRW